MSILTVKRWDGQPITEPGVYSHIPMIAYHSADICDGPSISSSGLRTIFTDCPMAYWVESPLNPRRLDQEDKEAFILGRAAHHLVLGEHDFGRFFVARPEKLNGTLWNGNRTDCKEWLQHVTDQGLTSLTPAQIEAIRGMAGLLPWQKGLEDSGLLNSAVVRAGALSGLVEHSLFAKDKETGVWLKSRPDAIPLDSSEFNDFKSTISVHYEKLQRTLDDFRYDMQADLASVCLQQAADLKFTSYAFIFAMKKPPHAVEVVELKDVDLEEARQDNRAALRTFAKCLETGRWPGPGGGRGDARYIERSVRSRENALGRRTLLELELEAA